MVGVTKRAEGGETGTAKVEGREGPELAAAEEVAAAGEVRAERRRDAEGEGSRDSRCGRRLL